MKIPIILHVPWFAISLSGTVMWSGSVATVAYPISLLVWLVSAGIGGLQDHQSRAPTIIHVRRQTTRRPRVRL